MSNNIDPQQVNEFQKRIENLMESDLGELYIQQLEKNAEQKNDCSSGLGLLTILNDYQARMGWKFESCQDNPQQITLTTMVQLIV